MSAILARRHLCVHDTFALKVASSKRQAGGCDRIKILNRVQQQTRMYHTSLYYCCIHLTVAFDMKKNIDFVPYLHTGTWNYDKLSLLRLLVVWACFTEDVGIKHHQVPARTKYSYKLCFLVPLSVIAEWERRSLEGRTELRYNRKTIDTRNSWLASKSGGKHSACSSVRTQNGRCCLLTLKLYS